MWRANDPGLVGSGYNLREPGSLLTQFDVFLTNGDTISLRRNNGTTTPQGRSSAASRRYP
jgi:hypothetical protein